MSGPPAYISGVRSGGFTYTSGQSVEIISGGVAYNMTINKGAFEYLDGGGSATATIVHQGGEVDVEAIGAYASGSLLSGGLQSVTIGRAVATVVYAGGVEDVSSSGTDSGSHISSGGGEHVYSGGIAYRATVAKGGTEFITQGGTATSATIQAGGRIIMAGDVLYDSNFTATSGSAKAVGVYKGGVETITFSNIKNSPYNKVVNTATANGYVRDYYNSGALVIHEQRIGNELYDTISGKTYSTTSPQYKSAGAASDITVASGGSAVLAGGSIGNLNIASGGTEIIGGKTIVHSGGGSYTFKFTGITVSGSTVGKGVKEVVNSGNIALSATISAGGTQIVQGGATAQDSIIDGGTLKLAKTAKLATQATFEGTGGTLVISAATMPSATISGFAAGDKIQLAGVKYVTGATAVVKAAGIVTITDGGATYALHIAGAAVGQNFAFSSNSVLTTTAAAARMQFVAPAFAEPASAILADTPAPQIGAAPVQAAWVRETLVHGTAYTLLTSAAESHTSILLSGGSSY